MNHYLKYQGAVYRQAYLFTPEAEQYLYHCTTYGVVPDVATDGLSPHRSKYRDDSIYLTEPAGLVQWIQWVKAEAPYRHAPVVAVDDDGNEVQIPEDFEPDENALPLQPVVLRTKILGQKELDRCGTDDASMCLVERLRHYFPDESLPPYERPFSGVPGETRDQYLTRHYRGLKQWERKRYQMEQQLKDRAKAYRTKQPIPPQELEIWTGDTWVPIQQWHKAKVPMDVRKLFAHLTDSSARFDPYTLEKKTASAVRYRGAMYRRADLLGRRVVDPYVPGGPSQPYLYHVTDAASLPQIRQQGLRPGTGTKWDVRDTQQHSQGRVFFSTQPDKWISSINSPDRILLRVPTGAVLCLYDGGEWLYSGDEPEDEIIDGRLADCYGTDVVPPHLIEYAQDVPDVITDTSTLAWEPLVPRKPNHIGAVVQYRGVVYRLAEPDESFYWSDFGPKYYRYMSNECYDFALALKAEVPAWEYVGIGDLDHVGLWDGHHYHDVRGRLTEQDFRRDIVDGLVVHGIDEEAIKLHAGLAGQTPPYRSPEYRAAKRVVQQWLEWYDYMEEMGWQ